MQSKTVKKAAGLSLLAALALSISVTPVFAVSLGSAITVKGTSRLAGGLTIDQPTTLNVEGGATIRGTILVKDDLTINPDPTAETSAFTGASFQLAPTSPGTVVDLGGVTSGTVTVSNGNVTSITGLTPTANVILTPEVTTAPTITDTNGDPVTPRCNSC